MVMKTVRPFIYTSTGYIELAAGEVQTKKPTFCVWDPHAFCTGEAIYACCT